LIIQIIIVYAVYYGLGLRLGDQRDWLFEDGVKGIRRVIVKGLI
jgi:hypothetical protein